MEDAAANPGLASDCNALLAALNRMGGVAILNWSSERPIGQWDGVTLDGSPLRVIRLNLSNKRLAGELPPELGQVSRLVELYLNRNELTGRIPPELGALSELKVMHLAENNLNGSIPMQLADLTALTRIDLSYNSLTGTVPAWLGSLSDLQALQLCGNELTGSIPAELANLTNLKYLYLEYTMLEGTIPADLGKLASLEYLYLSGNELSGKIPPELGSLSDLKQLFLAENRLTGKIPVSLGALESLEWLDLSENGLTGQIPRELSALSKLKFLDLRGNQLTGQIPAELGKLTNIERISLQVNQLTGPIPAALADLQHLELLEVSQNRLTGCAPSGLGRGPWLVPKVTGFPLCSVRNDIPATGSADESTRLPSSIDQGETLKFHVSALLYKRTDFPGGAMAISEVGMPINGTVELRETTITYVHDGSETTTGGFTYVVTDGVEIAISTFEISVRPVNDPPVAVGDNAAVGEGKTLVLEVSALLANDSDEEGDAMEISEVGEASNGSVWIDGPTIVYAHDGSETTTGGFTYVVTDGVGTAVSMVEIAVAPVNDPPVAVGDNAVLGEGRTLVLDVSALLANDSDTDGDAMEISEVGEAVNGSVRIDGTAIIYVHDGSQTTTGGFTYTTSDGVDVATAVVTVTVRPDNGFPVVPLITLVFGFVLAVVVALVVIRRTRGAKDPS